MASIMRKMIKQSQTSLKNHARYQLSCPSSHNFSHLFTYTIAYSQLGKYQDIYYHICNIIIIISINLLGNKGQIMGPKRTKKKGKNQDDEEFPNEDKIISKWAQALQNSDDQQVPDASQLYSKPTKAVFDYDFSNQKALDKKLSQIVKPKDKYADYTPQQLSEVKKLEQKERLIKQAKNKQKNEKRKQRKKQIDALKAIEKVEKQKQQEDMKKVQIQIKKQKSKQANPWCIPGSLLLFLILMFVLQYNQEIYERLAKFKLDQSQDYYQILQADQGTTDKQLKNKYKKLVMKYHPDRNPDCQNCKQKFDKIMQAWEILGDSEKRKQYDQNSGHISQLKSASTTLTPHNYHYLVEESKKLWMIQVYDSTNTYSRYFAQFWEEMVENFGDVVNFGRVDIWYQSDMSSYLPYKFQVFPSVYILDQGYSQICTFNFERPIEGLKKCIEQPHSKTQQKLVKQVPQNKVDQKSNKMDVYLHNKLRGNIRIKSYNKIFQEYFNFMFVEKQSTVRQAVVLTSQKRYIFNFTENSKKVYYNYASFLATFLIREVSTCAFLNECSQQKCLLVLNSTKIPQIRQYLPFAWKTPTDPSLSPYPPPIYKLTDNEQKLQEQIKKIQQMHGEIQQNFDLGLYEGENQRIDLGYVDQVDILSSEQGERFQLECKVYTWRDRFHHGIQWISEKFLGKKQE